jgi:hypothetical protein
MKGARTILEAPEREPHKSFFTRVDISSTLVNVQGRHVVLVPILFSK